MFINTRFYIIKTFASNPNFILLQHFHFSSKNTLISYLYIQWFQNLKFNSSVHNSTPEQQDSLDVQWKQGVIGCYLKKKSSNVWCRPFFFAFKVQIVFRGVKYIQSPFRFLLFFLPRLRAKQYYTMLYISIIWPYLCAWITDPGAINFTIQVGGGHEFYCLRRGINWRFNYWSQTSI